MKPYKTLYTLLAMALVGTVSIPAHATGWYVGAGIGGGYASDADSNVFKTVSVLSAGGVPVLGGYDSGNPTYQLFGGLRFNSYFAAEVGYIDFGKYTLNGVATLGGGYVAVSESDRIDALYFAAVGSYPINRVVSIFGKLGLASSQDKESCFVSGAVCPSLSDSATEPMFALGVEFPFTPARWRTHWAMRVEYDEYTNIGNSNNEYTAGNFSAITANAVYQF